MTQFERDLLRVLEEIKECLSDISINFEATLAAEDEEDPAEGA